MPNQGYNLLDSRKFDEFINARASLLSEYDSINQKFNTIVQNLANPQNPQISNWKGQGADAFIQDAQQVRTNIKGIQDILKTMCDTLIDCRTVFEECDISLGKANESTGESG